MGAVAASGFPAAASSLSLCPIACPTFTKRLDSSSLETRNTLLKLGDLVERAIGIEPTTFSLGSYMAQVNPSRYSVNHLLRSH